jgi:hypothetical protein
LRILTVGSVTAVSGVAQRSDAVRAAWVTADFDASERLKDAALVTQAPVDWFSRFFSVPARLLMTAKGVCSSETRRRPALSPAFSLNRPLRF